MFNCDQCNYKTKKEFWLIKHKNTNHGTMNENRDHLETGKSKCVSKEDKICPICGEAYRTETDVECNFKEKHLNEIDTRKHQTLSALVNIEAKETVLESETESLTIEEMDKLLDKYEVKMNEFDEFETSDDET